MVDFPGTEVAGRFLSRMIIGTNWILGNGHKGPAADRQRIIKYFCCVKL